MAGLLLATRFVLSVCRSGHLCSACSAVWSSRPQLQIGDGASFIILHEQAPESIGCIVQFGIRICRFILAYNKICLPVVADTVKRQLTCRRDLSDKPRLYTPVTECK